MQIKHRVRELTHDRPTVWLLASAVVVNLALWAAVWWLVPHRGALTPLHYTIYFGINLTGPWYLAWALPVVGSLVILIHSSFSFAIRHPVWPRLWMLLALVLNVLAVMGAASMILLIRSGTFS